LISSVTDEVLDEVKTWQNRQLDEVYPIMYLDAIQFKVETTGTSGTKRSIWRLGSRRRHSGKSQHPRKSKDGAASLSAEHKTISDPP
jgi:hypothetical protein